MGVVDAQLHETEHTSESDAQSCSVGVSSGKGNGGEGYLIVGNRNRGLLRKDYELTVNLGGGAATYAVGAGRPISIRLDDWALAALDSDVREIKNGAVIHILEQLGAELAKRDTEENRSYSVGVPSPLAKGRESIENALKDVKRAFGRD